MTIKKATWTATPQQVEALVAPVLPHTGEDAHIPMLRAVNLELDGDRLIAVATNRYSMAACWASLTEWEETNKPIAARAARIYNTDLKRLFAFLRPQRKDPAVWTLTADSLTVAFGAQSISIRTVETEWPKWRTIFGQFLEKATSVAGAPVMGLNPQFLGLFLASAKALGLPSGEPLRWNFGGPMDAPLIRIGDHFAGALMPVRLPEALPLDLTALGIESPKAVAA